MVQIEDIESDLKRRVDETRAWLKGNDAAVIDGLEARGTPCVAAAVGLIRDPSRKESDGALFRLEFGRSEQKYVASAEVRIKATSSASKDRSGIANGPYVAVYVVDRESGQGILSYFESFENPDSYFRSVEDSIADWYGRWLGRLLRKRDGATVFKHMERI